MFTGLIEAVGTVSGVRRGQDDWLLEVRSDLPIAEISLGDSIAVSGACLTVVSRQGERFSVEVSAETVRRTHFKNLATGDRVNLERALRADSRLDGHLVQGHVDEVGRVERMVPRGRSVEIWFRVSGDGGRYIVPKGSIAIDGVSLTVNTVRDGSEGTRFSVNIIPHTQDRTTLTDLKPGTEVNIETDLIGRYVERLLKRGATCAAGGTVNGDATGSGHSGHGLNEALLRSKGFV